MCYIAVAGAAWGIVEAPQSSSVAQAPQDESLGQDVDL
jgi:hypothetical protein